MNKHERRAYDAGRRARETIATYDQPKPDDRDKLNPFTGSALFAIPKFVKFGKAWESGWDSLGEGFSTR